MAYNTKIYAILNIGDLDKVNFNEVITTSKETIRKSIDNKQFLIKYKITPSFISDNTVTPVSVLNHEACLTLMGTEAWTSNDGLGK
tara:strand:- start:997 stop:1254 length:258 start_codon:yes stop_codon:yes gene_type:complete